MKILFCQSMLSIMFILLMASTGCAHYSGGPWMGKVIDSETKEPIEGAIVLAAWENDYVVPPEGGTAFVDAVETLTDKDGFFKIPAQSFIGMLPGSKIYGPLFTVFKPSYKVFVYGEMGEHTGPTSWHVYPKGWKGRFEKPDAVIELTKLTTIEERRKNIPGISASFLDHNNKKKLYIKLLREESLAIGLEPEGPKQ